MTREFAFVPYAVAHDGPRQLLGDELLDLRARDEGDDPGPGCDETRDHLRCSRSQRHGGRHVAVGLGGRVLSAWVGRAGG